MSEPLQEFVCSQGATLTVERETGLIRGVKVLGLHSRNGRIYRESALAGGATLYEGAKVNVNHARGSVGAARDYQDRIGALRGVRFVPGEGLYADLQINPKHSLSEQLLWDAAHAPENVGLSHNVEARTGRDGSTLVVEEIVKVQSVDLVADPAATRGLFESQQESSGTTKPAVEKRASLEEEIAQLREECAELRRRRDEGARRQSLRRWLAEYGLPDPDERGASIRALVSEEFLQQVRDAASDAEARSLVAERAELVSAAAAWAARRSRETPQAREQRWIEDSGLFDGLGRIDAAEFARSLR